MTEHRLNATCLNGVRQVFCEICNQDDPVGDCPGHYVWNRLDKNFEKIFSDGLTEARNQSR